MSELKHVKGLSELDRLLQELPVKIEKNVMRGAMRAAANVVKEIAKSNVPVSQPSTVAQGYGAAMGELRRSIRVTSNVNGGRITTKVVAGNESAFYPLWVEFGTRQHWVSVNESARPGRMTRRGFKKFSLRTLNRMAHRGSLVIGGHFVGESVAHPGAKPHPFMRPALDAGSTAAVIAAGNYIKLRLETKHGLDTADIEIGV